MSADDFDFALTTPGLAWDAYLARVAQNRGGVVLERGRIPATLLFAVVGDQIVGRVHIRHQLTADLLERGGHIGFGVLPSYRRRGYATEMLRLSLQVARDLGTRRVLLTCADDNAGSIGTIERCGGVLEDTRIQEDGRVTRRYWIDLA
jgi:predicted acetyltransferase